jgi:hypothetical protein
MGNICDYYIDATGLREELGELEEFLRSAVEKCKGGRYGESILDIRKLFPSVDLSKEHEFIGLEDSQSERGEPWSVEYGCRIVNVSVPFERRVRRDPNTPTLKMSGGSTHAAPAPFVHRLSERFPRLEFAVGGTTEHTEWENWTFKAGVYRLLEECTFLIQDDLVEWRIRDGVRLDPPVIENDPLVADTEGTTFSGCNCGCRFSTAELAVLRPQLDLYLTGQEFADTANKYPAIYVRSGMAPNSIRICTSNMWIEISRTAAESLLRDLDQTYESVPKHGAEASAPERVDEGVPTVLVPETEQPAGDSA